MNESNNVRAAKQTGKTVSAAQAVLASRSDKNRLARLLPGATAALLDLSEQDAAHYLQRHVERLTDQVRAVTAVVRRGDPAQVIVRYARQTQANLIVLGSHGKSHLAAFGSGSTTLKVSAQTRVPLLLVPVRDDSPAAAPPEP